MSMTQTPQQLRAEQARRDHAERQRRLRKAIDMHREDAQAAQAAGDLARAADLVELVEGCERQLQVLSSTGPSPRPSPMPNPMPNPPMPNPATATRDMGDLVIAKLGWKRKPKAEPTPPAAPPPPTPTPTPKRETVRQPAAIDMTRAPSRQELEAAARLPDGHLGTITL